MAGWKSQKSSGCEKKEKISPTTELVNRFYHLPGTERRLWNKVGNAAVKSQPSAYRMFGFRVGVSLQGRRNFHHLRKRRSRDRNKVGHTLLPLCGDWTRAWSGCTNGRPVNMGCIYYNSLFIIIHDLQSFLKNFINNTVKQQHILKYITGSFGENEINE